MTDEPTNGTAAVADLGGRTALVTGGGSGIGRAIALALAGRGADVVVTGRRPEALADTARRHERIRTQAGDVSDPDDAAAMVEAAVSDGRLDVLVNNAAWGTTTPLGRTDLAAAYRMWATNVLGPTLLTEAALPYLTAAGGSVVNVSSTFGARPAPELSQYGATKAALEQLTRSWALELADRGVRVNAVAPGPTASDALASMGLSPDEIEAVEAMERDRIPLRRRGVPEEVAPWVVAFAAPGAWVTGQVLGVDGGYVIA